MEEPQHQKPLGFVPALVLPQSITFPVSHAKQLHNANVWRGKVAGGGSSSVNIALDLTLLCPSEWQGHEGWPLGEVNLRLLGEGDSGQSREVGAGKVWFQKGKEGAGILQDSLPASHSCSIAQAKSTTSWPHLSLGGLQQPHNDKSLG